MFQKVDETYYEKNQLVFDDSGEFWILVDIIESKSLLSKKAKPTLTVFIRKYENPKSKKNRLVKVSFDKFVSQYTPCLHKDKKTIETILQLEANLDLDLL